MLRIYDVVLKMAAGAATVAEQIERRDGDLARPMRRAITSVALNTAEGMGNAGGHKPAAISKCARLGSGGPGPTTRDSSIPIP